MCDSSKTLKHFVSSNIKTVQATRAYLLDKPCTRCHHSTNLRVHLPTCSHRICSACLASFENLHELPRAIICPTCSTYWFTLPSVPKIENRSKESGYQIPGDNKAEKSISTSSISSSWRLQNGSSLNEASTTPQTYDHDSLDAADVSSLGTVGGDCSGDLDLHILRVQEQWKTFCSGQDGAIPETQSQSMRNGHCQSDSVRKYLPAFYDKNEHDDECVYELEAIESQTNSSCTAEMGSQNQGQTPVVDQEVVTVTSQIEEPFFEAIFATNQPAMGPTQSLPILLVMACLFFEFLPSLFWAAASVLSMRK